ncbi:MAG TPA: RNA polymerase sigma factor [Myxococcota bacterium]|nr:RNA polymerase sigma factor [Myxococcota bacterium]
MAAGAKSGARKRRAGGSARREQPQRPSSAGDEALLAGVRAGSEPHFNALYNRYFSRIYGFFQARARNQSDAEELTQEVFTAVFRSAGGFGERASPLSWIYGIARNTLLNYVRRRQLEREREDRLTPEMLAPPAPEWSYTPEEQYRAGELGEEIERRIRALAPWQLDAFRLRHIEDLTIQEISRRTTRSEDAVRSGLYRAKRLLFEAAEIEESDE